MDIKGKCNLFIRRIEGKKGIFTVFETSLSRKDGEEYQDKYTIRVEFDSKILTDEQKAKFHENKVYTIEIQDGFLTTRGYTNKQGVNKIGVVYFVKKCKWIESKEFEIKESSNKDQIPY